MTWKPYQPPGYSAAFRINHVDAGGVHAEGAMGTTGAGSATSGKCPTCKAELEEGKGHVCKVQHTTETLKGVEIFDVGTWNGTKNTDEDLDDLVESYRAIGQLVKPMVKLGHADDQKLLQEDGYPAAGWVTNLYRQGTKLVADLAGVPSVIAKLVNAGAYRRVSSEIYHNLKEEATGKTFRRVLGAIAFLGGEMPAVTTLRDIVALGYSSQATPAAGITAGTAPIIVTYDREETPMKTCQKCKKQFTADEMAEGGEYCKDCKEGGPAKHGAEGVTPEQYSSLLAKFSALEAQVQTANAAAESAQAKAAQAQATLELYERADAKEKDEAAVEEAIKDGRMLPANRDGALRVFAALRQAPQKVKYSKKGADGAVEEVEASPRDLMVDFLKTLKPGLYTKETLRNVDGVDVQVADGVSEDSARLDAAAKRYAADNKCDYKTALIAVSRANS